MNRLILLMFLMSIFACQKNIVPLKKLDLFREALRKPLVKNQNLPILHNEIFDEFSNMEINEYAKEGINIWSREDLFMRGISDFITIYEVNLRDEILVINFRYRVRKQIFHESVHFRK